MKKVRVLLSASMIAMMGLATFTMTSCSSDEKVCDVGYEGKDCKTLSRDKFIGDWKGTEECEIGSDEYTISIAPSTGSEVKIIYKNVYNQDFTATGTMTGVNGFSFDGSASGGVTFTGIGTFDPTTNRLTVEYSVSTSGVLTNSCTFKGTKL